MIGLSSVCQLTTQLSTVSPPPPPPPPPVCPPGGSGIARSKKISMHHVSALAVFAARLPARSRSLRTFL